MAARPSGAERRFYDGHDLNADSSIPTQASLLLFLDKIFHDSYLYLMESNKQQIEEVRSKIQGENSETRATPKQVWISPMHSASVAFS